MVGQFNDSYKPIMDGVGVCAENYARWLHRDHGGCVMVAPRVPGYTDAEEYPVLRYPSLPLPKIKPYRIGVPALGFCFKRALRRLSLDLVHAHSPFVAGKRALKVARRRGIPLVATFHTKYREDFLMVVKSPRVADALTRQVVRFYSQAREVWAPNRQTATTLNDYGYDGDVVVMPNGTDLDIPTPSEFQRYKERGADLVADGSTPLLLFVGQHRWEKNVGLIIDSAALLTRRGVSFRLAFVGTGYAEGAMKRRVREARLEDRTLFAGLVLDREILKAYYARATLFLFPSVYDNAPLVMREAAAFSCPSVLARGSSAAEQFTDRGNVFLTDNDPEAMATLLEQLLASPDIVSSVGREAQRTIHLPWRRVVEDAAERYDAILQADGLVDRT